MGHTDDCIVSKALPQTLADFRGPLRGRGLGKERKEGGGKGERGYWEGKEGGKGRGKEGKWKEEGKGWEGEFSSLALGGIDARFEVY